MVHRHRIHWLVCYDISDPKRLAKVHRCLKKEGIPVQYSVFMLVASAAQMGAIMAKLDRLIDPDADDVRAYPIPQSPWKVTLGATMVPEDMWIMETP